jgi:hypothetical protein
MTVMRTAKTDVHSLVTAVAVALACSMCSTDDEHNGGGRPDSATSGRPGTGGAVNSAGHVGTGGKGDTGGVVDTGGAVVTGGRNSAGGTLGTGGSKGGSIETRGSSTGIGGSGTGGSLGPGGSVGRGGGGTVGSLGKGGSVASGGSDKGGSVNSGGVVGAGGGQASGGSKRDTASSSSGTSSTSACDSPSLVWKTGSKTNYTSYPDPGSDECIKYSGCEYEGLFSACDSQKSVQWVQAHNIVSVFPDFNKLKLHDLCLKSGAMTIVVTVIDECADSDCSGCCTQNKGSADQLIDVESFTDARWGIGDGRIQWADLGPTKGSGCQ